MSNDYEKAVNALMQDVKDIRVEMKDVIAAVKARAKSHVDDVKDSLHESAVHRFEQVRDAAADVKRNCDDGLKSCAAKIEEHPLVSVLAAVGIGVALGTLIKWRRR